MEAGRELDALVAEKVMGWEWTEHPKGPNGLQYFHPAGEFGYQAMRDGNETSYRDGASGLPRYSTDIAAAWLVVDRMEGRGYWCEMRTPFSDSERINVGGYWAGYTPHETNGWNGTPDHWTPALTLPLAICLAALCAVGCDVADSTIKP